MCRTNKQTPFLLVKCASVGGCLILLVMFLDKHFTKSTLFMVVLPRLFCVKGGAKTSSNTVLLVCPSIHSSSINPFLSTDFAFCCTSKQCDVWKSSKCTPLVGTRRSIQVCDEFTAAACRRLHYYKRTYSLRIAYHWCHSKRNINI